MRRVSGLPPGPELTDAEWLAAERNQPNSLHEYQSVYGPVFTIRGEGRPPRVYVAEPELIREIFVVRGPDLEGQGTNLFRPLVGAGSLTFLNGGRHREARRILNQVLNPDDLRAQARAMAEIVRAEVRELPTDAGIPLQEFTNNITGRIIVGVLFGELPDRHDHEMLAAFDRAVAALHDKQRATQDGAGGGVAEFERTFRAARAELDRSLRRQLARRRDAPGSGVPAVVDRLISVARPDGQLADEEIVCYLITIMSFGQETTSSSLAWALHQLAGRQGVVGRLREELATAGAGSEPAGYTGLPLLRAVCMETLRHSSPVPNGSAQKVVRSFSVDGYTFREGVEIVPCICVAHQQEKTFEHAAVFDPDRFLERHHHPHEYLPFSVGARFCPGSSLAMQELTIALAVTIGTPGIEIARPATGGGAESVGPTVHVRREVTIRRTNSPR